MTCFSGRHAWHVRVKFWHSTPQIWHCPNWPPTAGIKADALLNSRRNSTTPVVPRRDENIRPEGIGLVARVWRFGSGRATLCVPVWWLVVSIGMACPRVRRLGSDRATLCNLVWRLWCWPQYGRPYFWGLGFDRATLCNLVWWLGDGFNVARPTLSDDLVSIYVLTVPSTCLRIWCWQSYSL